MVHDSSRLPYENNGLIQKLCTFAFIFWKTYSYDHLSKESGKYSFFGGDEGDGIKCPAKVLSQWINDRMNRGRWIAVFSMLCQVSHSNNGTCREISVENFEFRALLNLLLKNTNGLIQNVSAILFKW